MARSRSTSGPGSTARSGRPEAVDPAVRAFVGTMQREAFELPEWDAQAHPQHELTPPAAVASLFPLPCPTLVVVGDPDQPAVADAATRLARRSRTFAASCSPTPPTCCPSSGPTPSRWSSGSSPGGDARGPPPRAPVVALGDSYTIGTAPRPAERWPDQLVGGCGAAAAAPRLVANLGVNGFTSRDVIHDELPALDGLAPEFASILVGVNDVVQGFRGSVRGERRGDPGGAARPPARRPARGGNDAGLHGHAAGRGYGDPASQSAGIRAPTRS